MKANHGFFNRVHACVWLLLCAVLGLSVDATAAVSGGSAPRAGYTQSGGSTSIGPLTNSGGSTIPVSPTIGGWTQAGNYGVPPSATPGATMNLTMKGDVVFSGTKYPFQAGYGTPWKDLATQVGPVVASLGCSVVTSGIGTAVCATAVAAAVPYIKQWIDNAGGRFNPTSGQLEMVPKGAGLCYTAPCYEFLGFSGGIYYRSNDAACKTYDSRYTSPNDVDGQCFLGATMARANGRRNTTPLSPTWLPASMNDIAPYMGNINPHSGVVGEIVGNGGTLPDAVPTVTGPSSVQGPEVTKQNGDGTKEVSRTTYNFSTAGNTITNTSNVTTTNNYNAAGAQTTTTTTTTNNTGAATGTAAPDQPPEDQCAKYPDTLGCSKLDTPTGVIPKDTKTVTYAEESRLGGGSCPANKSWTIATTGTTVATAVDWGFICTNALPLRAMIMALAAFIALVIVMPGGSSKTD